MPERTRSRAVVGVTVLLLLALGALPSCGRQPSAYWRSVGTGQYQPLGKARDWSLEIEDRWNNAQNRMPALGPVDRAAVEAVTGRIAHRASDDWKADPRTAPAAADLDARIASWETNLTIATTYDLLGYLAEHESDEAFSRQCARSIDEEARARLSAFR